MRNFFSKNFAGAGEDARGRAMNGTQINSSSNITITGNKVFVNGIDVSDHNSKAVQGDGIPKTMRVKPQPFDSINVSAIVNVDFIVAEKTTIEITADSNLVDLIDLSYFGDTLDIGLKDNSSFTSKLPMKVTITHPELKTADVSGSARLKVVGIEQDHINASVSGAGDIELCGKVKAATLKVSGAGDVKATELFVDDLRVVVSGMGDIRANATNSVSAKISGNGDITVYGNPKQRETKCSGMGDIRFA